MTLEVTFQQWKGYFITLYRSPGQTSDQFYSFISNLKIASYYPDFVILLGDFNPKSKSWSINDTTTGEGAIFSLYVMKQLISGATHILKHSSNCIDSIFSACQTWRLWYLFITATGLYHQVKVGKLNSEIG